MFVTLSKGPYNQDDLKIDDDLLGVVRNLLLFKKKYRKLKEVLKINSFKYSNIIKSYVIMVEVLVEDKSGDYLINRQYFFKKEEFEIYYNRSSRLTNILDI